MKIQPLIIRDPTVGNWYQANIVSQQHSKWLKPVKYTGLDSGLNHYIFTENPQNMTMDNTFYLGKKWWKTYIQTGQMKLISNDSRRVESK